jgi:2-oxoisovalerate dehydrogenase E1 component
MEFGAIKTRYVKTHIEKTTMDYSTYNLEPKQLLGLYKKLLKPRLIEEKMMVLLRQGRISKWFSGWGQEAISVGTSSAMHDDEYICTMHRNLGVFTTREIPLERLFSQFQGKANGFTKGRDRSFHFGSQEHKIVGMISHLGPQLGVADGIALANKLRGDKKCTLVFTGDGGASEGDFHEALNVASVWNLPVLFVVENNQWGLSTPSSEQFNFESFAVKGPAYGMEAHSIDGNNIAEVYSKTSELAESIRQSPRPILLECKSFRIRGHEEASGTKYYPQGLIDEWEKKDPIDNFEAYLLKEKVISQKDIDELKETYVSEISDAVKVADNEPKIEFNREEELKDVFHPVQEELVSAKGEKAEIRMIDAISQALDESMEKFNELVLMGQDIGDYGGVFKITDGFVKKFGHDRVRNTPLCEAAIVGTALGLSINRAKAMMEMQFADFATEGFTQIVNNLAKIHWRWGQKADVVIRMPTGAGVGAGPYHSQSNEAWFTHTPGLKVVYPAFPYDAKGLLNAALAEPNPVLFFEHKALYRSVYQEVPKDYFTLPIGKASLLKEGNDLTIVAYGQGVHWALDYLKENLELKTDLIDLRSLVPLDEEAIIESVKKTGRALIITEDVEIGSIASDISSLIHEKCFEFLDAPVKRLCSLNTAVPFAKELEDGFLPKDKIPSEIEALLKY